MIASTCDSGSVPRIDDQERGAAERHPAQLDAAAHVRPSVAHDQRGEPYDEAEDREEDRARDRLQRFRAQRVRCAGDAVHGPWLDRHPDPRDRDQRDRDPRVPPPARRRQPAVREPQRELRADQAEGDDPYVAREGEPLAEGLRRGCRLEHPHARRAGRDHDREQQADDDQQPADRVARQPDRDQAPDDREGGDRDQEGRQPHAVSNSGVLDSGDHAVCDRGDAQRDQHALVATRPTASRDARLIGPSATRTRAPAGRCPARRRAARHRARRASPRRAAARRTLRACAGRRSGCGRSAGRPATGSRVRAGRNNAATASVDAAIARSEPGLSSHCSVSTLARYAAPSVAVSAP